MIDEAYVKAAARIVELEIKPEELPEVVANLQHIEAFALPLLAAEIESGDELAPVWTP
jgi:1-carboxybiuret hydrolase subunit AtzG-like